MPARSGFPVSTSEGHLAVCAANACRTAATISQADAFQRRNPEDRIWPRSLNRKIAPNFFDDRCFRMCSRVQQLSTPEEGLCIPCCEETSLKGIGRRDVAIRAARLGRYRVPAYPAPARRPGSARLPDQHRYVPARSERADARDRRTEGAVCSLPEDGARDSQLAPLEDAQRGMCRRATPGGRGGVSRALPRSEVPVRDRQFTQMLATTPDNPQLPDNWEAWQTVKQIDRC